MAVTNPFHLAIPVTDLKETRAFYRDILHCKEGRSDEKWVDFNLFGHQLVIHLVDKREAKSVDHNPVDEQSVPVPNFGVILEMSIWEVFSEQLRTKGVKFIIEPYIRFKGLPDEQATMFFKDPSGNALEFKAFKDISQLFAK
jgi:hypothetical protein